MTSTQEHLPSSWRLSLSARTGSWPDRWDTCTQFLKFRALMSRQTNGNVAIVVTKCPVSIIVGQQNVGRVARFATSTTMGVNAEAAATMALASRNFLCLSQDYSIESG